MTKPRYTKGKRIESMKEFVECDCHMYKFNGATRTRIVLENMTYKTLERMISNGLLYTAVEIKHD